MPDADAFPRPLTPGAYLKARRNAARLSVHDVAQDVATQPRWAEHVRADWIEQIEADIEEPTLNTIVALRSVYSFDLEVLATLNAIALRADVVPPRLCRICACSDRDPCMPASGASLACHWVEQDLCSACHHPAQAIAA